MMYYRFALVALLALAVAGALATLPLGEIATAAQAPFAAPLDTQPRVPVPCTADQPWSRHHFGFQAGAPTTGVARVDLAAYSPDARPPFRCEQPQTDAAILADAQAHVARLQEAIAAGRAQYQGTQGPKAYPPRAFRPGELLELVPELVAAWNLRDDGSEVLVVIDCYCDTGVLGVPLRYAEYLVLRYLRTAPGAGYLTSPGSAPIQRLTGDTSIPVRFEETLDHETRERLLARQQRRQPLDAGLPAAPPPAYLGPTPVTTRPPIPPPPGLR